MQDMMQADRPYIHLVVADYITAWQKNWTASCLT